MKQEKRPKKGELKVLIVEDAAADAELIKYELRRAGISFTARTVENKREFLSQIDEIWPDLILSDFTLPQFNALDALRILQSHRLRIPFILVTGSTSEEVAVECIKEGADDYLLKSSLKRLPSAIQGLLRKKQAEDAREQAQEQLQEQAALLNKARDAILVRDLAGRITFWSQSAERIYGWTLDEATGWTNDAVLFAAPAELDGAHKETVGKGEWHGELHQLTKSGNPIMVESSWSLVRGRDGQPKSILIISSDITEKKNMEAHFLRAQRMESIGTLAGGIAHDLNNVLTPILMALRLLKEDASGAANKALLETLETSAHRGAAIVQQVLSFARGVEGEKALFQVKHPLAEVIQITRDLFPRTIEIQSKIPKDLWPVFGDPTQLHQVFMNLFVNARDAMPNGGRLTIEAANTTVDESYARMQGEAKPGPYVVVTIADSGTGIPAALLGKIFEPFFTTKEVGKGTGLGLPTALGIVKSHGGFLTVYSEQGKGTSFKVHLPAADCRKAQASESAVDRPLPLGHGEQILVVDDELAIREIIKLTLETHGYKVMTATDGADAVAVFAQRQAPIAAAVVDMMMPYMDGPSTIRALSKIAPETRFIAISGLVENEKMGDLSERETVRFLAKPFTTEQLLELLASSLSSREAPAQR